MKTSITNRHVVGLMITVSAACGGGESLMPDGVDGGTSVVTLANNQQRPWAVTLDATHVYWTNVDDGSIMRVAKTGGNAETLATGHVAPRTIGVDREHVYVGDGGGWIFRLNIIGDDGRADSLAVPFASSVDNLVMTSTRVVLLGTGAGRVVQFVKGNTAAAITDVGRHQVGPVGLGADDSSAFWTTQGDGTIWTNGFTGEMPRAMLVDAAAGPARITLDATTVFWVGQADGSVRKVPKGGGAATLLATGINGDAFIATAGNSLYMTNDDTGQVLSVPKSGGPATVLASGIDNPLGIAADGSGVYVATATSIIKLQP